MVKRLKLPVCEGMTPQGAIAEDEKFFEI